MTLPMELNTGLKAYFHILVFQEHITLPQVHSKCSSKAQEGTNGCSDKGLALEQNGIEMQENDIH